MPVIDTNTHVLLSNELLNNEYRIMCMDIEGPAKQHCNIISRF